MIFKPACSLVLPYNYWYSCENNADTDTEFLSRTVPVLSDRRKFKSPIFGFYRIVACARPTFPSPVPGYFYLTPHWLVVPGYPRVPGYMYNNCVVQFPDAVRLFPYAIMMSAKTFCSSQICVRAIQVRNSCNPRKFFGTPGYPIGIGRCFPGTCCALGIPTLRLTQTGQWAEGERLCGQ
eukprot:892189-Rhodomonas_salina.1